MTDDLFSEQFFPEQRPSRPIWLVTLADLALLLVGFFVLVQANQKRDFQALAAGLREGFGVHSMAGAHALPKPVPAIAVAEPMPVGVTSMADFATGSSVLPQSPAALIAWVREEAADPRLVLKVIGGVDGSAGDVEPVTGSGSLLAADRARAVAVALASAHVIRADRMIIATEASPGSRRAVTLTIAFAGERP